MSNLGDRSENCDHLFYFNIYIKRKYITFEENCDQLYHYKKEENKITLKNLELLNFYQCRESINQTCVLFYTKKHLRINQFKDIMRELIFDSRSTCAFLHHQSFCYFYLYKRQTNKYSRSVKVCFFSD